MQSTGDSYLWGRWLFLRALGLWFFSAFYALAFQIRGLLGSQGILPVHDLLAILRERQGFWERLHNVPSLLWLWDGDGALTALWLVGGVAAAALILNLAPRAAIAVCEICFLSFVACAQEFSGYQSDGMLLSAGFCSLFLAPPGWRPGLAADHPPAPLARWALIWLWFTIYFGSGVVKLASGDPQWRNLTAMDHYYENGPLPTFLGWYVQQSLPELFHRATALATLLLELGLCWLCFFGKRVQLWLFAVVTPFQLGIIATSNYAFLNWLVLSLGVWFVDDRAWERLLGTRSQVRPHPRPPLWPKAEPANTGRTVWRVAAVFCLSLYFYVSAAELFGRLPLMHWLPDAPLQALAPLRIANGYGLFAVMTRARYEIEFQATRDGRTWLPYRFWNKPQALDDGGRVYAPYQPRFDWNLWFASLGSPRQNGWVREVAERLLEGSPQVIALFRDAPFPPAAPAKAVRAVRYQYWYTTPAEHTATGNYWRREERDLFVPPIGDVPLDVIDGGLPRAAEPARPRPAEDAPDLDGPDDEPGDAVSDGG